MLASRSLYTLDIPILLNPRQGVITQLTCFFVTVYTKVFGLYSICYRDNTNLPIYTKPTYLKEALNCSCLTLVLIKFGLDLREY